MSQLQLTLIARDYPSRRRPHVSAFVRQIVQALAQRGVQVTVIAPRPVVPGRWHSDGELPPAVDQARITVLRPPRLTFSNRVVPGIGSTFRWTVWAFMQAVQAAGKRLTVPPDCCYGHFLYPSGVAAAQLAHTFAVPAIVALGESSLAYYTTHLRLGRIRKDMASFAAVVAVSEVNQTYAIQQFGADPSRLIRLPNAIDPAVFYPRDQQQMRRRYDVPLDRPIIAFVGHFIERKGPLRVLAALEGMPNVGAVFLGQGPQQPTGPAVVFAGALPHKDIPAWLATADLFVLPTLAEGSCNAILEAMACGLPIVSSDLPFNHELLDDTVARLVDPQDVPALRQAIHELLVDPARRSQMRQAALERVQRYTIADRAAAILAIIENTVHAQPVA